MIEQINMNLFWKLTQQVNWSKRKGKEYLKVWVRFDDLEEFGKHINY